MTADVPAVGGALERADRAASVPGGGGRRPVVVVTGASEGIGLAIARRFAARGRDLLLVARRRDRLEAVATELATTHGVRADVLALDVTEADAPVRIDAALAAVDAHVDVLVNNAGLGLSGDFDQIDRARIEALIALNVGAPTLLMHHVLPAMRMRRRGTVINLASLGGFAPGPYQAAYYASRAYQLSLSEAVAVEVAGDNVRVMAVAPGPVNTRFHAKMDAETALYRKLVPGISPETVARWTMLGYSLGTRVVVPGLLNNVLALFLRILPHRIMVPIDGWLYRPRR